MTNDHIEHNHDTLEETDPSQPPVSDETVRSGQQNETKPQIKPPTESSARSNTNQTRQPSEEPQNDFRLALEHHKSFFVKLWNAVEQVFHYFFVGCIGLLGLAIVMSIPILILGCTAVVLGIPGFVLYQLLGTQELLSPYTIVLTIFWSGYFLTHGWPRLRDSLQVMIKKCRPMIGWIKKILNSFSEEEKEGHET